MAYHETVLSAIGHTPLVRLQKLTGPDDATVLVKLEYLNPGGSIKDRMAVHILEKAERSGLLRPGGTIVENTSGNTGVGLAMAAAVKGYRCVFTMPDKMSKEKQDTLKAFGAKVIVTPTNVPADSPDSYYSVAKRIAAETPNSFYVNQYHSLDNVEAHYQLTAPEIWEQTGGRLDAFVAGLGTGGTMSGCGKFFKEKAPAILNVGVDPIGSVYHSMFKTGKLSQPHVYKVEGIGEDMMCGAMDLSVLDDVRQVNDAEAFVMARRLAREEGVLAGGSSGAAVHVAVKLAKELGKGKVIVVPLPDGGRAYISKFYSDEWMRDNGFPVGAGGPVSAATVKDVLGRRRGEVISARKTDKVEAVVKKMKEHDISQMPVVDDTGRAIGMIHEYDLLNFLIEGKHRLTEVVEPLVQPLQGVVEPETALSRLRDIFNDDHVAVVKEGDRVTGIVTKIDLIEFLAQRLR
ncbi:Pyridoxal-5'-phosphate-dependent protein beta subunit [Anaeromyxobacter dehalogenans 2CP-1]|uniref:Pyridoxal-5'-phosphate-dependent protein beta subunit n=1 Tax=Anaeromyxobacter dehalogenans (strain ATCC BAA-258 / DSM 21875 / 2CP-1) TaxID=455488 RepID=B8J7J0_ANAD2|nr:pyridoxal-phosphate dependent enzyme [Anaeromyxobacter dehalogenans]ACL67170.1 Pyridoxal-5'-phosphate-dependent protein beta subunit [Anaeromyxobacter dehalogenans 2CP-1]